MMNHGKRWPATATYGLLVHELTANTAVVRKEYAQNDPVLLDGCTHVVL